MGERYGPWSPAPQPGPGSGLGALPMGSKYSGLVCGNVWSGPGVRMLLGEWPGGMVYHEGREYRPPIPDWLERQAAVIELSSLSKAQYLAKKWNDDKCIKNS